MAPHLMYTRLKCMHCDEFIHFDKCMECKQVMHCEKSMLCTSKESHASSQEWCSYCQGYVLPTRTHKRRGQSTEIEWNIFKFHHGTSDEVKRTLMKSVTIAIQKNLHVAFFGYKFLKEERTLRTMVFVHRPNTAVDKFSIRQTPYGSRHDLNVRAHTREWNLIVEREWEQFVGIVGEIPNGFPQRTYPPVVILQPAPPVVAVQPTPPVVVVQPATQPAAQPSAQTIS